jgi:hypothetical protein
MVNKVTRMLSSVEGSIDEHVTTHDIIIKLFGKYEKGRSHVQRRTIQKCLSQLIADGKIGRTKINGKTYGYFATKGKNDTEDTFDTCIICGGRKHIRDLDSDGMCMMCADLASQTTASPNPHLTSDNKRISRAFGNPDGCKDESMGLQAIPNPNGRNKIDIFKVLTGCQVRIILPGGRLIHGVLKEIASDGFLGLQTDFGPSVINPKHIASIQPWDTTLERDYKLVGR